MTGFPEGNLPGALKISSLQLESFARKENFWKHHKPEFLPSPHLVPPPTPPPGSRRRKTGVEWARAKLCSALPAEADG